MNKFEEFNKECIDLQRELTLEEYFSEIIETYYTENSILFKELFEYSKNTGFSIYQDDLLKYGLIKSEDINEIKRYLKSENLIKERDYFIKTFGNKENVILSQDSFKKCLMRAEHTDKYCDYFLVLEKIYVYYNEYISRI
jgi:hypothetical protein